MFAMVQIYGRNLAKQFNLGHLPGVWAAGRKTRIRLQDGTPLLLRAARPEDSAAVLSMHAGLSSASLFFRYMGAYRPTRKDIEAVCALDGREGLAVVATTVGRNPAVAGLAYLVVESDRLRVTAEPAIVIAEEFHGRGLGRRLFTRLCRLACKKKIAALHTYVHRDNLKMLRILRSLQYPVVQTCHSNLVEAEIVLDPDAGWGWLPQEMAGISGGVAAGCSRA